MTMMNSINSCAIYGNGTVDFLQYTVGSVATAVGYNTGSGLRADLGYVPGTGTGI